MEYETNITEGCQHEFVFQNGVEGGVHNSAFVECIITSLAQERIIQLGLQRGKCANHFEFPFRFLPAQPRKFCNSIAAVVAMGGGNTATEVNAIFDLGTE